MKRKKRIKALILSILMLFTYTIQPFMGLGIVKAENKLPEPYKYWGIAVSAVVDISNGGSMQRIVEGRNLKDIEGIPTNNIYGKDLNATLVTDISVPKEYVIDGVDSIMAFDDYRLGNYPDTENKDSDWKKDKSLIWITHMDAKDGTAAGLPFTMNKPLGDGKSFDITINVPDKEYMRKTAYTDRNGTTDGSDRKYNTTLSFVLVAHHEKFNPETGEWDIESKVEADLKMTEESPAVFNYKDFDENIDTSYSVNMDASGSSSARPNATYTYDMGIHQNDGNVDYKNEKSTDKNQIVLNGDVLPEEIYSKDYKGKKSATGTFRVDGTVEVKDDKDVSATSYADTNVGFEIVNEKPTAIYKATDKATSSDKYLYAKRSISIKDQSLDPEANLMDSDFSLYDGEKKIANWTFKKDTVDGTWTVVSSAKLDEYIEDMSLNAYTLENTLTFKKSGNFKVEQRVGDIRGHEIVDQKFDTRNSYLNIRPESAPPKADFEYRLNGKTTDYTYPNVEVSLLDKSTDENDDIVSWQWTKHNGTKYDGQNGATAVFPSEGTYNTSLKVTDFLGLSDSITKPIQVLPPIPKAEIVTNEDESLMKKNRRIIISSEESFAPPSDPIQWDKTKWKIEPLDGQSSSSIKISNSLSDNKKKAVVFKETGRYKVTIDLENNYTQANPNHPRISLKTTSIVIDINEDIKPNPQFQITGNAPNFKDNPISTTAKVANTSSSPDNDYLDIFPDLNLDDPNNYYGRGKNAFEMEIRKDKNEDGIFSDSEIYGKYTTRSVNIPVNFKENEGSDYQARLVIKETFGQPTITEFVDENDRVTNTLVKNFSINWIPFIQFDLPDWAYPDDEITVKTTLKDERVDTTKVVWTVDKKNTDGTYTNLLIDSDTINNLIKEGGKIRFPESGFYRLSAEITDEKGQKSSHSEEIRIYPFPTAVISDNPLYRFDNTDNPQEFHAKQNRTYELSGQTSHINDYFGTGIHEIDHSKDYFEIIPMDGQTVDSIKVTNGLFNLNSEDSSIFKATNTKLDREMLFKMSGSYKVRYQVTNVYGKKSPMAEQIIYVNPDEKPIVQFELADKNYRNPSKGNIADITAYSIKVSSPDRDTISLERLRYRFDSNNNGSFEDETWKNATLNKTDQFNWKFEVSENHVGKYQFELYAEESFGQPTIERYVDRNGADKRFNLLQKTTVVDNKAPNADFSITKREKADVVLGMSDLPFDKVGEFKTKAENIIGRKLTEANIDSNINIVPMQSKFKVLEINQGQETLQTLMARYGNGYASVDTITLDQFEANYNNIWANLNNYDSVVLGFSNKYYDFVSKDGRYANKNPYIINETPYQILENFIKSGKGVVFTHDTLGYNYFYKFNPILDSSYFSVFDKNASMSYKYDFEANNKSDMTGNQYYVYWNPNEAYHGSSDGLHNMEVEFEAKPINPLSSRNSYNNITQDKTAVIITAQGLNVELGTDGLRIYNTSGINGTVAGASIVEYKKFPEKRKVHYKYIQKVMYNPNVNHYAYNNWRGKTKWELYLDGVLVSSGVGTTDPDTLYDPISHTNITSNDVMPAATSGSSGGGFPLILGNYLNKYKGYLYNVSVKFQHYSPFGLDSFNKYIFEESLDRSSSYTPLAPYQVRNQMQVSAYASVAKAKDGKITSYPYTIPSNLSVSPTHSQYAYEDIDTEVWYKSPLAADRGYYLASKNNVYFLNAGNTDPRNAPVSEQQLIVNTIFKASSHRKSNLTPADLTGNFINQDTKNYLGVINNEAMPELTDPSQSVYILSKLMSKQINFSLLGTATNKAQFDSFNSKNENNGKYFDNSDIDKALNDYADYIIQRVKNEVKPTSKYILVNEKMDYKVHYSDYENDPQMTNINNWKYDHNPYFFENSLGQIANSNVWLNGSIDTFDKTGKYLVEYRTKDNPVGNDDRFDEYRKDSIMPNGAMSLYVHRKPIAKIKTKITKNATNITANLISEGFDLDHQSELTKGIRAWEWSYKEVGSNSWIDGGNGMDFTLNGSVTKDYLVKHRVQDIDGENGIGVWSDDNIILVTAKSMPPVADFEVTSVYPLKTSLSVTDYSYDPNGDNIVEYRWKLSKGTTVIYFPKPLNNTSGVTQSEVNDTATEVKAKIDSLGNTAYGLWTLELQVRDSSGVWGNPLSTSESTSRTILVVPNNSPPVISIKPTHVFVDGKNTADTDNLSNSLNNFINWNLSVSDPDTDNKGFLYRWELEYHEDEKGILKNTSEISNNDKLTTKVYTSQYPFTNQSFESNNLLPGPYKVRLQVTDIPAYGEAKRVSTEKNLYIVPKINAVPYVVSDKEEILCGDTVTLRVVTDKVTTGITAEVLGQTIELSEVRKNGDQYIWESPFVIPEIEDSSNIDIDFTVKTDYGSKDIFGSDAQTTRIKKLKETVYITSLKLEDFRVTDLVKHSQYKDLYPLRRDDFTLDYIAGYYCTFAINAKGNPERVFAKVSHDNTETTTLELKKIGSNGTVGIWEGKYFAPYNTPKGTIISFDLEASKGTTKYNYNDKESWDGATLEVKDTLLKDAAISRTN